MGSRSFISHHVKNPWSDIEVRRVISFCNVPSPQKIGSKFSAEKCYKARQKFVEQQLLAVLLCRKLIFLASRGPIQDLNEIVVYSTFLPVLIEARPMMHDFAGTISKT